VVRWAEATPHPPVIGVLASAGRAIVLLGIRDIQIDQGAIHLRTDNVIVGTATRQMGDVALAHDVLDHQLVDMAGVQVVRAADVYLANVGEGWELAGIDVGLWALLRRVLPRRRRWAPDRALDWADLQAFVAPFQDRADTSDPGVSAGVVGSTMRLSSSASEIHSLRARDVASLMRDLDRPQQAALAAMADPATVSQVLGRLDRPKLDALLGELDESDRERLMALLSEGRSP
jgi:hypothetical protein